jgi:hypothetical protein
MKKEKKQKKCIALSAHSSSEFPLNFPLFHFKKSRKSGKSGSGNALKKSSRNKIKERNTSGGPVRCTPLPELCQHEN